MAKEDNFPPVRPVFTLCLPSLGSKIIENYTLPLIPSSNLHSQTDVADSKHPQSSDFFSLLG